MKPSIYLSIYRGAGGSGRSGRSAGADRYCTASHSLCERFIGTSVSSCSHVRISMFRKVWNFKVWEILSVQTSTVCFLTTRCASKLEELRDDLQCLQAKSGNSSRWIVKYTANLRPQQQFGNCTAQQQFAAAVRTVRNSSSEVQFQLSYTLHERPTPHTHTRTH